MRAQSAGRGGVIQAIHLGEAASVEGAASGLLDHVSFSSPHLHLQPLPYLYAQFARQYARGRTNRVRAFVRPRSADHDTALTTERIVKNDRGRASPRAVYACHAQCRSVHASSVHAPKRAHPDRQSPVPAMLCVACARPVQACARPVPCACPVPQNAQSHPHFFRTGRPDEAVETRHQRVPKSRTKLCRTNLKVFAAVDRPNDLPRNGIIVVRFLHRPAGRNCENESPNRPK